MSEKVIEHPARALEEIKAEVKEGVIKDSSILDFSEVNIPRLRGFAVFMTLSTKLKYTRAGFENWRRRLKADDYVISVSRNQLKIRFDVPYSEDTQES